MTNPTNPIPNVDGKMGVSPAAESVQQPSGFGAMMNEQNKAQSMQGSAGSAAASGPSPMDITRPPGVNTAAPSYQSLLDQTKGVQDGLSKAQSTEKGLNNAAFKDPKALTGYQKSLIKGHLKDASNHINQAAEQVGVAGSPASGSGTIAHFLAWVGQGQDTMVSVQGKLQEMAKNPDSLNPADMLLVQTKMNQAQNEIQFSTTLMGKVIESFKTILQTQL